MAVERNPWWTVAKRNPNAALRLFCFPYAGGNAFVFRGWPAFLPADVEVYGIQLPGRGNRGLEPPVTRIAEFVTQFAAALATLQEKPFAFFGHSLGALLSFETARWLRRNKQIQPKHLFLSAYQAPQIPDDEPPWHLMSDEELLAKMVDLNGTPPEILENQEMLALMLPILRADCELCETNKFTEEEPLDCPITTFAGTDDDEAEDKDVAAWQIHTTGPFKHHLVEGDHFFIRSNEQKLLELMRSELSRMLVASAVSAR